MIIDPSLSNRDNAKLATLRYLLALAIEARAYGKTKAIQNVMRKIYERARKI